MKLLRRILCTVAFLLLSLILVSAAKHYNDLLFLFYPSFSRELLGYLASWTAKFDFVLWQRLFLLVIVLFILTLVLQIIRRKNVLHWLFSWTAIASFFLFLATAAWGLNYFSPTLADDMRLDVASNYSSSQLQDAAQYYLAQATQCATQVPRDAEQLCAISDFNTVVQAVDSGFNNMTRSCSSFGGYTQSIKPLALSGLFRSLGIRGTTVCFTGETCFNTQLLPAALPFEISRQVAQRMSMIRPSDSAFAAILACTASDDPLYQYSGYFMAYSACYNALASQNPNKAAQLMNDLPGGLKVDLIANGTLDGRTDSSYLPYNLDLKDHHEALTNLLIAWQLHLEEVTATEDASVSVDEISPD